MKISEEVTERLRSCQKTSVETISKYLRSKSEKSCLISLPTGAGKSGVICVASHSSKSKRVLVLTHRRAICDQLTKQLKGDFYKKILGNEADISSLKSVFKSINNFEKEGVYCTTVQMITTLSESELDSIKDQIELVIFDEGHAEPASKWSKAVRKFECKKIIITATPYRNDLFSFDIDTKHHYIYTFKKAVENQDILEPIFKVVAKDMLLEKIREIKISQPDSVCIIKCKEFSDVQEYFNLIKTEFNTAAIHDKYANSSDENTLKNVPANINNDDYDIIIHQKKLDEGVDIPQAKTLILTYPISSGRELVQTVGRVIRIYEDYQPYIIEINEEKNLELWSTFKEFDEYLSNEKNAEKFIKTLDTNILLKSYINELPEHSYYKAGFKKKFSFQEFNPIESLQIPLASVCFYKKNPNFNLASCLDRLSCDFNRQGALSKSDPESGVITSIVFNNSKFLRDSLFLEPSLEIILIKELGNEYIAIFDSQGRKLSNNPDLGIGKVVNMDTLFKAISLPNKKTLTKQANTKSLQKSDHKPESISYIGNLDYINHPATNSTYAITTGRFATLDNVSNKIDNSYYLGVASGRISDQRKQTLSYEDFIDWLDTIYNRFQSENILQSNFIGSFAKLADSVPEVEPSICVLDFTKFENLSLYYEGIRYNIDSDFIYRKYIKGFSLLDICNLVRSYNNSYDASSKIFQPCLDDSHYNKIKIIFSFDDKGEICVDTGSKLEFYSNEDLLELDQVFNKDTVKLLYDNGITFLEGEFFEHQMPTESGKINEKLMSKITSLNCLLKEGLSEKDESNTSTNSFGENSIFYEIDKLSNVKNEDPNLSVLGDFYQYLPNVDLILCTDLGKEPADFILSSPDKLVMAHVKCGSSSKKPQSSAGAIAEVGSQAIKNLDALVGQKFGQYYNQTELNSPWKVGNNIALDSRIRLYNKEFDPNTFGTPSKIQEVLEKIEGRRKDVLVKKEMWIIVGNHFSASHFRSDMENISNAKGTSKQAYQLIDTWLTQLSNYEVELKLFVSP